MIGMLISLLVFCIVAGLFWWIITMIPLPAPFAQIVRVVFVVICVLILIFEFLLPLVGTAGHIAWR
jgi:hypothetical protein